MYIIRLTIYSFDSINSTSCPGRFSLALGAGQSLGTRLSTNLDLKLPMVSSQFSPSKSVVQAQW